MKTKAFEVLKIIIFGIIIIIFSPVIFALTMLWFIGYVGAWIFEEIIK